VSMPSISVLAVAATVAGIFVALFWYISGRSFRFASTSQELLDLFEDEIPGAPKSLGR